MYYLLHFLILFFLSNGLKSNIINKKLNLEGIWKEKYITNSTDVPLTLFFPKDSDSVLYLAGSFGGENKFYKYKINGDTLLIKNFLIHIEAIKQKDYKGKIYKNHLMCFGQKFNKLKQPKLLNKFDEIVIVPNNVNPIHYISRFTKFTLSKNGKYVFISNNNRRDRQLAITDTTGNFNNLVFPYIFSSLEKLKEEKIPEARLTFDILFYKNNKLIKTIKNDGSRDMLWIFEFVNLYTYHTS